MSALMFNGEQISGTIGKATSVQIANSETEEIKFGIDENGNYGYIKAGADTVTPFKSGVDIPKPVLLWENSNPSSAFVAQTVNLDLSEYEGVLVECNISESSRTITSRSCIKKGESLACGRLNASGQNGASRLAIVKENGVEFKASYSDATVANTNTIPTKIYGVKGVLVENVKPKLTLDVLTSTETSNSLPYGIFRLSAENNNFETLKIDSFIESSILQYLLINIDDVEVARNPSVGSSYDIKNKKVMVSVLSSGARWTLTGATITLE